ncbi:unnamed protein product [Rotaria sp. Silwood2]|nr:unnamed protein product [Rotaria sp. Silwood2]CAF2804713.1 unnamed protein product [Rotaria sp. Silwood2]CAF4363099.1 unnamed protein product [Rotaria sp. Silwood2]CAF4518356.1 unnamed protein product [Rotaria sp. Silwood2]
MSTIRINRAQSAYHRPSRQPTTNVQASHVKQRPTTSMNTSEPETNVLSVPAWRTLNPSAPSGPINSWQRPKTTSISTITSTQISADSYHPNEIERLLRCLDRNDKRIVHVDCLADYRRLVQTIDIRSTLLDRKSLCALQQRENRIIQRNACRDVRFHSLLDALAPSHAMGIEQNNSNNTNHNNVSEISIE